MTYTIHSQDGRLIDVTLQDEGIEIRKKMELIKYGIDVLETETDEEGNVIEVVKLHMVDPFDDLGGFLSRYLEAYKQGKEKEAQDNDVPVIPLEEEFFHSPQVDAAAAE